MNGVETLVWWVASFAVFGLVAAGWWLLELITTRWPRLPASLMDLFMLGLLIVPALVFLVVEVWLLER